MTEHTNVGVLVNELETLGFNVKIKGSTLRVSGGKGSRLSRLAHLSQHFRSPIQKDRPKLSSLGYIPIKSWNIVVKDDRASSTHYEDDVVSSLNDQYKKFTGHPWILIGDRKYPFDLHLEAKKVPGTPKADIRWGDIWISHKAGEGADAFQQYSGISETAGLNINGHWETKEFLRTVASRIVKNKLICPLVVRIRDENLKRYAVYGPSANMYQTGPDNVDCIGQGDPILTKENGGVRLTFSGGIHCHGEVRHLTGDYEPVFAATFRTGRCFVIDGQRYEGARVGIYPYGTIKGRSNLLMLNW